MGKMFIENVDYRVCEGSFGTHVLRAIPEGISHHKDGPLYAATPEDDLELLPVEGRKEALDALIDRWRRSNDRGTMFGVYLDPHGIIGVDTLEYV